jgi:hypothetical protein
MGASFLPSAFCLLPCAVPAVLSPDVAARIAYWERLTDWAIPAYLVLFAAGALMMLIAVFRPRSASAGGALVRSRLFQSGAIVLLILCALSNQTAIDNNRGFIADEQRRYDKMMAELERRTDKEEVLRAQYLYMPSGNSLAYMTMGNPGLAADYLWLTSTQYVSSSFRRGHKFEMLLRFYRTLLELDPHWIDALRNAGKVLSALEPDRFAVEKFYMQAVVANPGDWQLPYDAGRLFVVPPLNLYDQPKYSEHAAGWLKAAMAYKNFPDDKTMRESVTNLLGKLSAEAGYYEAADAMLYQQATDRNGDPNFGQIAARDWMNVRSIRLSRELTSMAAAYKQQTGAFPPDLATLLKGDAQAEEIYKKDAFGFEFVYNLETGKVESLGVNVRKTLTVENVVSTLIQGYRGTHEDRPPATLEALRDWTREIYSSPSNQPSAGMKEALGSDLDPTRCPLGKWDYNPQTGKILLPAWCNATQLYLRTEEVMNLPPPQKKTD